MLEKVSEKKIDLFEFHNTFDQHIQVSYKGPFDRNILADLGNYIKIIIGKNPKASKRLFKIFIELAQNIAYYSAERNNISGKDAGVGTIVIGEFENYYAFMTGNVVSNEDIGHVIEKCKIINTLDRDGLRKYKRELHSQPQGTHGAGHIGLIQVAITSANPLEFKVSKISESDSFFALTVRIEK